MVGYSGTEMIKWLVIVSVAFVNENYTEILIVLLSSDKWADMQQKWCYVIITIIKSITQYCWQMKTRLNVVYKMETTKNKNNALFFSFLSHFISENKETF